MSHEHNVGDSDESADEKKMEQHKKAGRQESPSEKGKGGCEGPVGATEKWWVGGREQATLQSPSLQVAR